MVGIVFNPLETGEFLQPGVHVFKNSNSKFFSTSESFALELLETHEEMFPCYW